ncbi:hypothetical protein HYFRA_00003064 [Hymenoscyphus fraxineus]|uniref:Uncharacterized protein n=1 Tax=Hymenoscyphus fraxineus TaxID=746836 RepID=A0A9N9KSM3_9HELO|nr:hypothetical protein HYFRA_00003064 [Hymenoscyphus fraxineus]
MNNHTNKNAISQEKQRKAARGRKIQERMALHNNTEEAEYSDGSSEDHESALEAWDLSLSLGNDERDGLSDSSDEYDPSIYADSTEDEYSAEDAYWSQVDNPEFQNEDGVSGDDQYAEDGFLPSGQYDEEYDNPNYSLNHPDDEDDEDTDSPSEDLFEIEFFEENFSDDDEFEDIRLMDGSLE